MLRGVVPTLEEHHAIMIRDDAVVEAVRLSQRFIPDRRLPAKAISVLDTGSGDDDVFLRLNAQYVAAGELVTKANDETIDLVFEITDVEAEKHTATFTLDKALVAANDHMIFKLDRVSDGSEAQDNYQGNIGIIDEGLFNAGI